MIVLGVLGVKSYHIILHSLWVMCLVFSFLSGVTDLLEELMKNRVLTLAVISYTTTEDICKLMPCSNNSPRALIQI